MEEGYVAVWVGVHVGAPVFGTQLCVQAAQLPFFRGVQGVQVQSWTCICLFMSVCVCAPPRTFWGAAQAARCSLLPPPYETDALSLQYSTATLYQGHCAWRTTTEGTLV